MNWRTLDLNLLVVFDAVAQTRSAVSAAISKERDAVPGSPAAREGRILLEDMGAYPHLVLSSTRESTEFVDDAMEREGLTRRTAFIGPLLAAPAVLTRSDMIA